MSRAVPAELRRSWSGELSALAALFVLTLRQHTHGRRLLVLALLYALPVGLAVLLRSVTDPPPGALEFTLVFGLLPHGLAPLTALLYAAGMVRDEVEEQTLTYLLVRPLPRWALYVTKFLATLCLTTLVVAVGTFAIYAAIGWNTPDFWTEVLPHRAVPVVGAMALGQVAYCGLFGLLGVFTRRSLVTGVAYIVAVEGVLANIDFVLRSFTVVYYFRTLILHWLDLPAGLQRQCLKSWGLELEKLTPARDCVWTLLGFGVAVTALTAVRFARSEFRVKTPDGG
jgi:ABC-2 type transport system permease protein